MLDRRNMMGFRTLVGDCATRIPSPGKSALPDTLYNMRRVGGPLDPMAWTAVAEAL